MRFPGKSAGKMWLEVCVRECKAMHAEAGKSRPVCRKIVSRRQMRVAAGMLLAGLMLTLTGSEGAAAAAGPVSEDTAQSQVQGMETTAPVLSGLKELILPDSGEYTLTFTVETRQELRKAAVFRIEASGIVILCDRLELSGGGEETEISTAKEGILTGENTMQEESAQSSSESTEGEFAQSEWGSTEESSVQAETENTEYSAVPNDTEREESESGECGIGSASLRFVSCADGLYTFALTVREEGCYRIAVQDTAGRTAAGVIRVQAAQTAADSEGETGGETVPDGSKDESGGETVPDGSEDETGGETLPDGSEDESGGETVPGDSEECEGKESSIPDSSEGSGYSQEDVPDSTEGSKSADAEGSDSMGTAKSGETDLETAGEKSDSLLFAKQTVYTAGETGTQEDTSCSAESFQAAQTASLNTETQTSSLEDEGPQIQILDVENCSANSGMVRPRILVTDENLDTDSVTIELSGAHSGKVEVQGEWIEGEGRVEIWLEDFAYEQSADDVYELCVSARDVDGNCTRESILFSVNRFGSVYTFDEATEALAGENGSYYMTGEQDIVIFETNTDTLEEVQITLNVNGTVSVLSEGTDYDVSESGSDFTWKQYCYTIDRSCFSREGVYVLTLCSKDRASNLSDNNSEGHILCFAVDKTAPSVIVTGVEDGALYRGWKREITVDTEDNLALETVTITLNGEETVIAADEIEDGIAVISAGRAKNWQTLVVTAADAAGNTVQTEEISFCVRLAGQVFWTGTADTDAGGQMGVFSGSAGAWFLRGVCALFQYFRKKVVSFCTMC